MREALHRFADIHYGKSPTEVLTMDSEVPIFGTGGRYGSATRPLFNGPAVIVARKGSLGNPHLALTPFWASDTTYAVVPKPGVDVRWLYYSLSLFDLTKLNEATGVPSINRDWLRRIELESATPDQQRRIAEILGTVDEVIEQTEALIAKQQQVKAGLMHDLFTRGVTATGTLRPPPAEAPQLYQDSPLGPIPKEWEVKPLAAFTQHDITYGIVQAGPHIENGVPYIRTGDMSGDRLIREDMLCTSRTIADSYKRSEIRVGEIVCAIRATVGKVLVVPLELDGANLTQGTARIAPNSKTDPAFLLWSIRSERTQQSISLSIKGTTFMEITLGDLRRLPIAAPISKDEQRIVGARLDESEITIQAETAHLAKLRQEKQGLMQDLLTGRVPVPA